MITNTFALAVSLAAELGGIADLAAAAAGALVDRELAGTEALLEGGKGMGNDGGQGGGQGGGGRGGGGILLLALVLPI